MKRHRKPADNHADKLQYIVKCTAMLLFLGALATVSVVSVNTDSYVDHTTEASQKIESLSNSQKKLPRLRSVSKTAQLTPATATGETTITGVTTTANQTAVGAGQAAIPTATGLVLANGNTAGVIGTEAAARMAAATGVPQATWEYIIARESNGDPTVVNPSGAAGLFQTIPGWGSTATVEDQIQTAIRVYQTQGLAAWELP